jgi:cell division protein FtsZ
LNFADVKAVMKGMGVALMGIGVAKGEGAAVKAMKAAINSQLLEENSIKGARGALINITGSKNMPLIDIENALALIHNEADENANIIFGTVFDETMEDEVKITVVATGFEKPAQIALVPDARGAASNSMFPPILPTDPPTKPSGGGQKENFDVPTFIRRQAD